MFVQKTLLRLETKPEVLTSQPKCHCVPAWNNVLAPACVKLQQAFICSQAVPAARCVLRQRVSGCGNRTAQRAGAT